MCLHWPDYAVCDITTKVLKVTNWPLCGFTFQTFNLASIGSTVSYFIFDPLCKYCFLATLFWLCIMLYLHNHNWCYRRGNNEYTIFTHRHSKSMRWKKAIIFCQNKQGLTRSFLPDITPWFVRVVVSNFSCNLISLILRLTADKRIYNLHRTTPTSSNFFGSRKDIYLCWSDEFLKFIDRCKTVNRLKLVLYDGNRISSK